MSPKEFVPIVFSPEGKFAYGIILGKVVCLSMLPEILFEAYKALAEDLEADLKIEFVNSYVGQFVITFQTEEDLESFCKDINWYNCPDAEGHPSYRNLVTFKDINVTEIRNEAYNLRIN